MSLYGAMTTALSGLRAQSRALGNVSDNIANSQTVGYKRVDTNFISYLTESSAINHAPGSVVARPVYNNTVQGTVQQSDNPLALAIGGQGMFSVTQQTGEVNGTATFDQRPMFTRAGDFRLDKDGYFVNGSNYYLQGWSVDMTTGTIDRTTLRPIQMTQPVSAPVATSTVSMTANLPASPTTPTMSTQVQVYDSLGTTHAITLNYTKTGTDTWTMTLSSPDNTPAAIGSVNLKFGAAATPAVASGTLGSLSTTSAPLTVTNGGSGTPATITIAADFGQGTQNVTLDFGKFAAATGMTQYSGSEFAVHNLVQDGVPPGSYSGISMRENGDVAINYDNGQSRVFARVPLVSFQNANQLQPMDGQAFMATEESGSGRVTDANTNGVGKLTVGSVELANVDIADEFSKMIVAQRAYTANTRIVTTSDELLQESINMKR